MIIGAGKFNINGNSSLNPFLMLFRRLIANQLKMLMIVNILKDLKASIENF